MVYLKYSCNHLKLSLDFIYFCVLVLYYKNLYVASMIYDGHKDKPSNKKESIWYYIEVN